MKWTNKYRLPKVLVDAITSDDYSRGKADISVTELIGPPRLRVLKKKYADKIVEDVSDGIYRLLGKVMHKILEEHAKDQLIETRRFLKVKGLDGKIWTISGAPDIIYTGMRLLQDYKFTTSYKFSGDKVPIEYEQQLNIYIELLAVAGVKVTKAEIVGILRDWSKMKAWRDKKYPQRQIVTPKVNIWSQAERRKYIKDRVIKHQLAEQKLPLCTPEERWATSDKWAVMKVGRKSAVALYDTEYAATEHAKKSKSFSIEYRPGKWVRCEHYCPVAKFCSQYRAFLKTKKGKTNG